MDEDIITIIKEERESRLWDTIEKGNLSEMIKILHGHPNFRSLSHEEKREADKDSQ